MNRSVVKSGKKLSTGAKVEVDPYSCTVRRSTIFSLVGRSDAHPVSQTDWNSVRIFWPPYNLQPTKHLSPRQDMLEVLVRSVASPGEILEIETLQNRLWDTFGIVIGGRSDDLSLLLERGYLPS